MVQLHSSLCKEVEELSGEEFHTCYQCKKCTLGCPMAFAMDYGPHQILRLLQYGMEERIWESETLWLCLSCETCGVRCPNGISVSAIMDALRIIASKRGLKTKNRDIPIFHQVFLESIKKRGRIHEISMLMRFKGKTLNLFEDLMLGWDLFSRGKLPIKGHSVKEREEMKEIFSQWNH